ncbi:MAG: DNA gyrase inhibitor YacG [Planctomycetota bacterium]
MAKKGRDCPTCGLKVERGNKYFPFCSKRCLLADLDNWLNEKYRLKGDEILFSGDNNLKNEN